MRADNWQGDVVVLGGGLVGGCCALALAQAGYQVALLEARPQPVLNESSWDSRVYAISPGSEQWLDTLGVWPRLPAERLQPVLRMEIFGDRQASQLDFDAASLQQSHLATLLESSRLQQAIDAACAEQPRLRRLAPVTVQALQVDIQQLRISLASGQSLQAQLLVGADGGQSWVRNQAGIGFVRKPYPQTAIVANFECSQPHGGIARQWFRPDGVLAYLPLPGARMSMVWSANATVADTLLQLPPQQLAETVAAAGANSLGALKLITPAAAFPLQRAQAESLVAPRIALVGDAAHLIHPLAGQGVNLGLQDARELVARISNSSRQDVGDWTVLRAYARARAGDIQAMLSVTDGLQRLFAKPDPLLAWLRNTGLNGVQHCQRLKRQLALRAFGG
jgi:2-octaprenylphenol hydroxylase